LFCCLRTDIFWIGWWDAGKYAAERVKQCAPPGVHVGYIMHPSPANPKANKDWDKLIEAQLRALGVDI